MLALDREVGFVSKVFSFFTLAALFARIVLTLILNKHVRNKKSYFFARF